MRLKERQPLGTAMRPGSARSKSQTGTARSILRQRLSRSRLEARCLTALRETMFYRDLTAVDVDSCESGAGDWAVVRLWRGHVVELPQGRCWDAGGRETIACLATCCALDEERAAGPGPTATGRRARGGKAG